MSSPRARVVCSAARSGPWRSLGATRTYRNYADAVSALNGLQSNSAVVEQFRKSGMYMNQAAIPEMLEWLRRAGYEQSDLSAINALHIAGTKGKGSTSAFVSSILAQYRVQGIIGKVGLFTSPHLRFVRERIAIDGKYLSEEAFAEDFFEVFDRFEATARRDEKPTDVTSKPAYFRYLTIMAFHSYIKARVETAVIECGMGGEYDSTNVLANPTVTAITSLGIDHKEALGDTLESIAWHKAGIFKKGAAALTVPQPARALDVLHARAKEKKVRLEVVPVHPEIENGVVQLGLGGSFQKWNASLAVEVAAEHLRRLGHSGVSTTILPAEFVKGLAAARLGGRCETRHEQNLTWYLDGAHTVESIQAAAEWFSEAAVDMDDKATRPAPRILIFNQQNRDDARALLVTLRNSLSTKGAAMPLFDHGIFCTNVTFKEMGYRPDLISINSDKKAVETLKIQHKLADSWRELDAEASSGPEVRSTVSICRTVEEALAEARVVAAEYSNSRNGTSKAKVLVTGSMHLVGGVLEVLETQAARALHR